MATGNDISSYDVIFAGGGATACVTAGRLAQADPSLKILILEAGSHTKELPEHIQPGRFFSNLTLHSDKYTFHTAKSSEALAGRSLIVPSGRCLGGGSSLNFMTYTRAAASDYDDWKTLYGNNGWSSKDLIPLLKKAETYQPSVLNTATVHGFSGPIKVSLAETEVNVAEQFLAVASKYDKDRALTEDLNAFFSCNEYGRWPRYIDGDSGRRSDTPHNYIYNQAHNVNLKILHRQRVIRVIFEDNRAVGVEYVSDVMGRDGNESTLKTLTARASRFVLVSAGAFGSPAILERSGIGGTEVLLRNNVEQIVNLPGVGEHYMDHNLMFASFLASEDADTMDIIFHGTPEDVEPHVKQWKRDGKGLMSHNSLDAGIKLRPTTKDIENIGSEFQNRWKAFFETAPDKPVILMSSFTAYVGTNPEAPRRKYFNIEYWASYPLSLGNVHISDGRNPYAPLDFQTGFLEERADLAVLRWAYKKARELARRMDCYRGDYVPEHPEFSNASQAIAKAADGPVDISEPDIIYTSEDDNAIDEHHRKRVETTWHSMGTCAMKPREQGGVVDERMNVYGVRNLKVADCSICPGNVGANTYNTALAIGEKAAIIIAEDLGIKGVMTAHLENSPMPTVIGSTPTSLY